MSKLTEVLALSEKATMGPFVIDSTLPGRVYSNDATGSIVAACVGFEYAARPKSESDANAALFAAAVNFLRSDEFGEMVKKAEGWQRMTAEARAIQARHLGKHDGDVYHVMQHLAVKFGCRDHGPMTQPLDAAIDAQLREPQGDGND